MKKSLEQPVLMYGDSYASLRIAAGCSAKGAAREALRGIGMLDWLRENGRDVSIEVFGTDISADVPVRSLAEREDAYFRSVGIDTDTEPIIRETLGDDIVDDVYRYRAHNRMRLVYWRPRGACVNRHSNSAKP